MDFVICKQYRATKAKVLVALLFLASLFFVVFGNATLLSKFVFFLSTTLIYGFSIQYKITKDFDNKRLFCLFGFPVIEFKLNLVYPEYVSIFSGSFSIDNNWSTVSALGTKERHSKNAVRFFNGNRYSTVYISSSFKDAEEIALQLSEMLEVELFQQSRS